ncbi:DUF4252 domain-containing protein [Antarcticibacterium flavum]|uniref:DUF4252 domain-containing protein n=1 Tax=Antarcticibacterium flavum TaxID=2058175 RepID=A0A5B7X8Z9_9FLAO|nr:MULTISPECIES: DUF4252 domain-containing protein [Antarcticibacterium]MCM4160360.1 DUF4252 domain-containing protein [Antarcticibacterium sp. W02-3]QCY71262.1 DUF4252 domain-containing protein [Antarcticibacterium flavum]
MKKLVIFAVAGLLTVAGYAQTFDKYDSMKEVDAVVMTSKMFKLLSKVDLSANDPEAQQYLNLIDNLKEIRVYSSHKPDIRTQMATDVSAYLKKGTLDELMRVSESGNNIKFYSKPGRNDNFVSELFMFMEGQKDGKPVSVIMSITGDLDLTKISQLTSELKVPGSEELKNVKTNNRS